VGLDPGQQHILETLESGSAAPDVRSRRFFDGLGRVYQEEAEQNAGTFAITVRGWGPRGEQACESLPFHGTGETSFACDALTSARIETDYDALLRPLETRRVVGAPPNVVTTVLASSSYSIADLDAIAGNELIETQTVRTEAGWDRITRTGSDPSGRPVAIDEAPAGGLTRLLRDAKGRIVVVDGPVTDDLHANDLWITYNHLDQRTSLFGFWPSGGWSYEYDLDGNLSVQTSPAGKTIRFHWDVLDRLALEDYGAPNTISDPGIGEDVIYTYDSSPSYGIGRLALVDTPEPAGVDTSFGYDLRGRVASKVRNFGGSGAYAFSYVYDAMGRRVFANLPNGKAIRHFYDGSALEEIRIGPPNPGTRIASDVLLHPSGAIAAIDYWTISGGSAYTYEPDTHRLATATSWNASGTLQDLVFDYDLAGNLTDVNDALNELDQVFTYDGLHRLATATGTGSSGYGALGFGYDAAGNLLSKGAIGSPLLLSYAGGNAGRTGSRVSPGPRPGASPTTAMAR
jgi:YD repeat-containing protein